LLFSRVQQMNKSVFRQELYNVHNHFCHQLRKATCKEPSLTVGECFLTCKEKFLVHGNYCSNLLDAQSLVDKLTSNSASFNARLTVSQLLRLVQTGWGLQVSVFLTASLKYIVKYKFSFS